tara:strand:- start:8219 stop:9304 length:1086 start_codon:yes stop_codon:yes gene_type:complete
MTFTPRRSLDRLRATPPLARRIAVALPLVAILGYAVFWFTVAGVAEKQVRAWIAAQAAHGVTITHGAMMTGGFPFRVDVRIAAPAAAWPGGTWRSPELMLSAAPWDWRRLNWRADGVHDMTWTGKDGKAGKAALTARHLEGWGEAGRGGLPRVEAWLTDGSLALAGGPVTARGLLVQILPPGPDDAPAAGDGTPRLPISVDAKGLTLPPGLGTVLGHDVDRLALEMSLNGPVGKGPWPEPALSWRDAGGVLEIKQLGIVHGPLNLTGEGTLAIDPAGQPEGAFTARVTGFAETVEALRKAGIVDNRAADAVQVILGLLSKGPAGGPRTLDVPMTLQDRTFSLGAVPLLRLKPVDWFTPSGS